MSHRDGGLDLTKDRILPASADYYEFLRERQEEEERDKREKEERRRHRRRTVLPSIIDDPACMCGAKHVLKPVSRSVPRTACARRIRVPTRLHPHFLHPPLPSILPFPTSFSRLGSFTPPFAAGSSDFREARMWAGPDSRLPTPYFRR